MPNEQFEILQRLNDDILAEGKHDVKYTNWPTDEKGV